MRHNREENFASDFLLCPLYLMVSIMEDYPVTWVNAEELLLLGNHLPLLHRREDLCFQSYTLSNSSPLLKKISQAFKGPKKLFLSPEKCDKIHTVERKLQCQN